LFVKLEFLNQLGLGERGVEECRRVNRTLAVVECDDYAVPPSLCINNAGLRRIFHVGRIHRHPTAICQPYDIVPESKLGHHPSLGRSARLGILFAYLRSTMDEEFD
jgi:hypothetical protein